jgi:polyisoprenoid-binding protein YceI
MTNCATRSQGVLIAALLFFASTAPGWGAGSTTWKVDPVHSSANFTATHLMISHVKGIIPIKSASIVVPDGSNIPTSATAELDPSGINTQNGDRDSDLRSAHFFDVANNPKMTFVSTSVTAVDTTHFTMVGNLTMHGQTHPVTLTGQYLARGPGFHQGETRIAYTASGTVDRTQWGMTYGVPMVSANMDLEIDVEAASGSP